MTLKAMFSLRRQRQRDCERRAMPLAFARRLDLAAVKFC
jgi:hypothetical protein